VCFPSAIDTYAYGINDDGQIVGYYSTSSGQQHGFVYSHGHYTTLNDPSATYGTEAYGINDHGQIVGEYADSSGAHDRERLVSGR
jgi:probable HAF family extracellular repeat protein